MQALLDFLSSPIWQGIQGIVAVLAVILSLSKPRQWFEQYGFIKWILRIPWILLFIGGGIAAGLSIGIKFQDIYRGLSITFFTISVAIGIQWMKSYRLVTETNNRLSRTEDTYKKLLKTTHRIVDLLHPMTETFIAHNWFLYYSIDEQGNGVLREEVTILPNDKPVYFYMRTYSISSKPSQEPSIKFSVETLSEHIPLEAIEFERSEKHVRYAILLDPPSTIAHPKRIGLNCERPDIWSNLLEYDEDQGWLLVNHQSNFLRIEFIAPTGRKWKGFYPTPVVGDVQIEPSSEHRITWGIKDSPPQRYSYKVFLKPDINRKEQIK